jgi:hypothetical protein
MVIRLRTERYPRAFAFAARTRTAEHATGAGYREQAGTDRGRAWRLRRQGEAGPARSTAQHPHDSSSRNRPAAQITHSEQRGAKKYGPSTNADKNKGSR